LKLLGLCFSKIEEVVRGGRKKEKRDESGGNPREGTV
jgi:hypothetical protein